MLEPATNTNQNKREGRRNKKHKTGNKDSNKSYRSSDNIMTGKNREDEDGGRWGKLGVYMLESRQAEGETRVIPLSGPARQPYS